MPAHLSNQPMDESELGALAELLDHRAGPHGGMSLEVLDGFFSALIVGPDLVMPSEYLPHVWADAPEWEDLEQAQDGLTLLMRFWNHIVWRVQQPIGEDASAADQIVLIPPFGLPVPETADDALDDNDDPLAGVPDDFPFAAGWASGFLLGVSLRQPEWNLWLDQEEYLQADIALLMSLAGLDDVDPSQGPPMGLRQRIDAAMEVPDMLAQMYGVRLQAQRPQPIRRQAVPGRNDPCPCGSGRKYKKCCGDGASLH